jgi:hypothetical protein
MPPLSLLLAEKASGATEIRRIVTPLPRHLCLNPQAGYRSLRLAQLAPATTIGIHPADYYGIPTASRDRRDGDAPERRSRRGSTGRRRRTKSAISCAHRNRLICAPGGDSNHVVRRAVLYSRRSPIGLVDHPGAPNGTLWTGQSIPASALRRTARRSRSRGRSSQ